MIQIQADEMDFFQHREKSYKLWQAAPVLPGHGQRGGNLRADPVMSEGISFLYMPQGAWGSPRSVARFRFGAK